MSFWHFAGLANKALLCCSIPMSKGRARRGENGVFTKTSFHLACDT